MGEQDSHCHFLLSSKTTAKGMGLAESEGKEDPVEQVPYDELKEDINLPWRRRAKSCCNCFLYKFGI